MEPYIRENVSDITYQSEPSSTYLNKNELIPNKCWINSPKQLTDTYVP